MKDKDRAFELRKNMLDLYVKLVLDRGLFVSHICELILYPDLQRIPEHVLLLFPIYRNAFRPIPRETRTFWR